MPAYGMREVRGDDHAWLIELHNDPHVLRNLTSPRPVTPEGHMRWWRSVSADPGQLRTIFTVDGSRAGFCKFYSIDHDNGNVVLGADMHASFRGQGHARHMWGLMLDTCFVQLDLHRASLTTAAFNSVARRLYSSLGFTEEGRFVQSLFRDGAYHDQVLMYLLRDQWASRRGQNA